MTVTESVRPLHARDVGDLILARGYPCVSVLLPTTPAPRLLEQDRVLLEELVGQAEEELVRHGVLGARRLVEALRELAEAAASSPTERALALYVGLAVQRSLTLALPTAPLVTVEGTFATRPLVASLLTSPPHLVLVLHETCAHVHRSVRGRLEPAALVVATSSEEPLPAFLERVEELLVRQRTSHPSPLVLAGSAPVIDRFLAVSGHLDRLAGRVAPEQAGSLAELADASAVVVERYLRSRRADALRLMRSRVGAPPGDGTVVGGLDACWEAAQHVEPRMLLVEDGFVQPGGFERGSGVRRRHDLVDDLIEVVIERGGQVALVDDGDLAAYDRVALVLA